MLNCCFSIPNMSAKYKLFHPSLLAFLVLLAYLSPNIFFMHHARYLVHDNLDSNVAWYKMLTDSGLMFAPSNAMFYTICDGIPRGCMPSELHPYVLCYLFFSPLVAYNINTIILHIVPYIGMYLLLTDYVFKKSYPAHTAFLSLSFAILPYWPSGELSVAGQPLIIWAFLNILNKNYSLKNWLLISALAFYSDFISSNLFFGVGIVVLIFTFFIVKKEFRFVPLLALALFMVSSILSDYRLFFMQFVEHLNNQRSDFLSGSTLNFKGFLGTSFLLFLKGQYHFHSLQWPVIVIVSVLSLFVIQVFRQRLLIGALIFSCLICATLSNLHSWAAMESLFDKLGSLKSVQLRFITMLPVLWHLIFAFSIYFMLQRFYKLRYLLLGIILINIFFTLFKINSSDYMGSDFASNTFYDTYIYNRQDKNAMTFKEYYSDSMFSVAKNKIRYKNETVLCIGFPSEMAQYNNIYTAAAYYPYLPAYTKQKLAAIFLPELQKLKDTAKEQAIIGSRRFQYYYHAIAENQTINLKLDTVAMKKMHIRYFLSLFPINTYHTMNLDSIGCVFNTKNNFPNRVIMYRAR